MEEELDCLRCFLNTKERGRHHAFRRNRVVQGRSVRGFARNSRVWSIRTRNHRDVRRNWSGVVWRCIEIIVLNITTVTAVWYSFAQFLKQWWIPSNCTTIPLNSDHATLLAHDSLWSRIIYSRTFRRFERSPRNTLSARLTSQGLTSGHLLSAWVLILSFCDESCLRAISATGLALLTCGSLLRTADSYPVAI